MKLKVSRRETKSFNRLKLLETIGNDSLPLYILK